MTLMQRFYNFLNAVFFQLSGKASENNIPELALPEAFTAQDATSFEESDEEESEEPLEERINVAKRTLMTKLYMLEQEIAVFENDFSEEYNEFLQRIENLRTSYNSSLEELKKLLTFEIDPDDDTSKISEVIKLEKDIHKFIESTVKFHIISKRLQRLIKKLNILYNVSIFHSKECEKAKVYSQLECAIQSERKMAEEFKNCYYILADRQLKERIIELLSYVDYLIFKSSIRNSSKSPENLMKVSVMMTDFNEFDYVSTYMAFLKDEFSDLLEFLPLISNQEYQRDLKAKSEKLLIYFTYSSEHSEGTLLDLNFWNEILTFESNLLEMLKMQGIEKEKVKVKLIDRMNITVSENEVLASPKTTANVALVNIFTTTHDERVLLLIKLLKNISEDITYKEIYFLLLLFEILEEVKSKPNDLMKHIEKYIMKYPYGTKTIRKKKQEVFNVSNKEYVVIFNLEDYEKEIVQQLEKLDFDFQVKSDNVFVNSFYFNGLENVLSSLQANTNNL